MLLIACEELLLLLLLLQHVLLLRYLRCMQVVALSHLGVSAGDPLLAAVVEGIALRIPAADAAAPPAAAPSGVAAAAARYMTSATWTAEEIAALLR